MGGLDRASLSDASGGSICQALVAQDESPASLAALHYADALCASFGAQLAGLMFGLVPCYPLSLTAGGAPDAWIAAQRQAGEEASLSERRLRSLYAQLASPNDLKRVDAFEHEAPRLLARRARTADLTLIGWTSGGTDSERALFEACLFDSGRPVIVLPAGAPARAPASRALVAWNGSRESARALREALPLLRQTRLTRVIVADAEDCDFADAEEPVAGVERFLAAHHIPFESKRTHSRGRDVALVLAEECDQFGAALMVLGGFGYPRGGQWQLGEVTRSSLATASVPMLFAN